MKASELKNMADKDILQKIAEDKAELAKMKFSHNVAGTENPMKLRVKRREIARMKTILTERKNNGK
jgi:large subunit ribosomal protein L29